METIFNLLHQSRSAAAIANDLAGRQPFFELGIVTDNQDPLNKRRVKVTVQSKGGRTTTDWLYRLTAAPAEDPPLPRVGQTVGVMFVSGDTHRGVYFGAVTNIPNPEQPTDAPVLDDARVIEGDRIITVGKSSTLTVEETITIQNAAGASITLNPDGTVSIVAPQGVHITCQSESTINGKAIAVLSATTNDSEGNGPDQVVTSGQL